jgi:hypothetical protein
MCPACIATVALIVAGATSGGGLAALAMKKLRGTTGAGETDPTTRTSQLESEKDE